MTLPFVDFVNLHDLPAVATDLSVGEQRVDLTVRTYNDEGNPGGRRSGAVDLAAGVQLPRGHWNCDLEILVLSGELDLAGQVLERFGYLFLPAGVMTGPVNVTRDARILVFASQQPALTPAEADLPGAPRHRVVGPVHLGDLAWEQPRTDGFPAGAGRKTLRMDAESAEGTWVLGLLPHWTSPLIEWHEFHEEIVILEGEMETPEGVMTPGSYLAHPPGEHTAHGPMRSRAGCVMITRSEGPFATTYSDAPDVLDGPWR